MSSPIRKEYKFVISVVVKPSKRKEYENWLTGINAEVQKFDGFMGIDVIRPRTPKYLEYVIIMKFSSHQHLIDWQDSNEREAWLKKSRRLVIGEKQEIKPSGLLLYFTLPDTLSFSSPPPYYKLVMIGITTVYPLILLFKFLFGGLVEPLHDDLEIFLSVIFVSLFLTYPLMPLLTDFLDFWLYPVDSKQD
ncbi:MAG: antibiotic biosynthesis monooxygenase [Candidatus Heimdallarchaeota archaeon]|nr:antibiotic biosynthesis monooxygenase [Candidatus Heimdallarchaeota archaeon]